MKRITTLFLTLFFVLALAACGGAAEETDPNVIVNVLDDGTVHTIYLNEQGTHERELLEFPGGSTIENLFEADGSRIETGTDPEGSVRVHTYDKDQNHISEIGDLADGTHYELYFDENGEIIPDISILPDKGPQMTDEAEMPENPVLEYDENGTLRKEIFTDTDGSVYEHYYDENGNHIKETSRLIDGSYHEFEYDLEGNVINEVHN